MLPICEGRQGGHRQGGLGRHDGHGQEEDFEWHEDSEGQRHGRHGGSLSEESGLGGQSGHGGCAAGGLGGLGNLVGGALSQIKSRFI